VTRAWAPGVEAPPAAPDGSRQSVRLDKRDPQFSERIRTRDGARPFPQLAGPGEAAEERIEETFGCLPRR